MFVYDNPGGRYRIKYLTGQLKLKSSSQGVTEASKQSVKEFHSLQLLVCSGPLVMEKKTNILSRNKRIGQHGYWYHDTKFYSYIHPLLIKFLVFLVCY